MTIITILVSVFFFFSVIIINKFSQSVIKNYEEGISFFKSSIDYELESINDIALQMQLLDAVKSLEGSEDLENFNNAILFQTVEYFNYIVNSTPLLDNLFVYYPSSDHIVGDIGSFNSRSYYYLKSQEQTNSDIWIQNLLEERNGYHFINEPGDDEVKLILKRSRPIFRNDNSKPDSILIAEMNKDEFQKVLEGLTGSYSNTMATVPGYISVGNMDDSKKISVKASLAHNNMTIELVSGKGSLLQNVHNLFWASFIILCVSIVFGLILAIILSRRNMMPLEKLIASMEIDEDKNMDEIILIGHKIDTIIQGNMLKTRKIETDFLNELLMLSVGRSGDINKIMLDYGIHFLFTNFQICNIILGDNIAIHSESDIYSIIESWEENYYKTTIYYYGNNEKISLLVNYENEKSKTELLLNIYGFFKKDDDSVRMGISERTENISQVSTLSYHSYRIIGKNPGIYYCKIQESGFIESENKDFLSWQSNVINKNYRAARSQISSLLSSYLDEFQYHVIYNMRWSSIINQMVELVHINQNLDQDFYIAKLLSCNTCELLFELCKQIFESCIQNKIEDSQKNEAIISIKIKKIIDENLTDPNLCLTFLSEEINMTNSYISRTFNKENKSSIVDYINQLRVDMAKKLLRQRRYTIKEIAVATGFNSDINFIRVFKKYEKTTPGRF